MSRSYVVSLPVLITVADGLVTYEPDTSEAGQAILEDDDNLVYEGDLAEDIEAVEADHARRALPDLEHRLAELVIGQPDMDVASDEFYALVYAVQQTREAARSR